MNITNEMILAQFNNVMSKMDQMYPNVDHMTKYGRAMEIVAVDVGAAVLELLEKYYDGITGAKR